MERPRNRSPSDCRSVAPVSSVGRKPSNKVGSRRWRQKPRPPTAHALSASQAQRLREILLHGPLAAGFATDLWTCFRVSDLIQKRFGISYHFNHVGRLLHDLGFSQQQPQRRARERDEAAIARWREYDWPRIKKGDDAGKLPSSFSMKRAFCSSR